MTSIALRTIEDEIIVVQAERIRPLGGLKELARRTTQPTEKVRNPPSLASISEAAAGASSTVGDRFDERAALVEVGAGVPRQWAEAFARLDVIARPPDFTAERWRQLIDDGARFLDVWAATFVPPMKPTLVDEPPAGAEWIHEIKHDGFRTLLVIEPEGATANTSSGLDWTWRYRRVVKAAGQLEVGSATIDGEMVVQDERGVSDFEGLRAAIDQEPHRLVFFAFDLLHLDGEDLRNAPITAAIFRLKTRAGWKETAVHEVAHRGVAAFRLLDRGRVRDSGRGSIWRLIETGSLASYEHRHKWFGDAEAT
ncbi:MAG: hypothetical protein AB7S41_02495 [Parvibaculaceae bacterium]